MTLSGVLILALVIYTGFVLPVPYMHPWFNVSTRHYDCGAISHSTNIHLVDTLPQSNLLRIRDSCC
jgi:hypothetical protein